MSSCNDITYIHTGTHTLTLLLLLEIHRENKTQEQK